MLLLVCVSGIRSSNAWETIVMSLDCRNLKIMRVVGLDKATECWNKAEPVLSLQLKMVKFYVFLEGQVCLILINQRRCGKE